MARTARCGKRDARQRLRFAQTCIDTAELIYDENVSDPVLNVSTALAVLAGIAAGDSICCMRLGEMHRGDNHRDAIAMLQSATSDGKSLGTKLARLLDVKDGAHYAAIDVSKATARAALRNAVALVERAAEEVDR